MSLFGHVLRFVANIALFSNNIIRCRVSTSSIFLVESMGGNTELANLALACPECNHQKGTDIGSRKSPKGKFIRLFNPRTDIWHNHFELNWAIIRPKTAIGEITVKMLGFNDEFRIVFRKYLMLLGVYP